MQSQLNHTPEDEQTIQDLLSAMKGGAEAQRQRGTLANYLASLSQPIQAGMGHVQLMYPLNVLITCEYLDRITLPKRKVAVNIRKANLYTDFLRHAEHKWPDLSIQSDRGSILPHETPLYEHNIKSFATMTVRNITYGAYTHKWGKNRCFAYFDKARKSAGQILYLSSIVIVEPQGDERCSNVAVVRRFIPISEVRDPLPTFPWGDWCVYSVSTYDRLTGHPCRGDTFLRLQCWKHKGFKPVEVIPAEDLSGMFGIADLRIPQQGRFWFTKAIDHVRSVIVSYLALRTDNCFH